MTFSWRFRRSPVVRVPLTQSERQTQNFNRTVISLGLWIIASVVLLVLCAFRVGLDPKTKTPWADGLAILCHGGMLGLACGGLGGLIGFLFGIPRTPPATPSQPTPGQADVKQTAGTPSSPRPIQSPNTNLEEVSDWLTKIILGAGLTQLVKVPEKLKSLGDYLQADFAGSKLLPETIAVHSVILGFFAGYLITRLFLAGAFAIADSESADAKISRVLRIADEQAEKQNYGGATAALETAITSIGPNTPPETTLLYYERLTYSALYEPSPMGFQKAIEYFNQYLKVATKPPSARLYVNLACAYGQQYDWEKKHDNRADVLTDIKNRALDAVQKALQTDPGTKGVLQFVWDPNANKVGPEENDLEVFYEDPEFQKLLK